MNKPSLVPALLSGHPYAAAVCAGSTATGVVITLYALTFSVAAGPDRLPTEVVAFDLAVAAICLAIAWAVARAHISSSAALEFAASAVLVLAYWTCIAEMIRSPARAEILTTHCCLVLVAAGVVIRARPVLLALSLGALTTWTITVGLIHAPHFIPGQWWSTWVLTVAIAFLANLVARTERGVEHTVRRAAQSSSWRDSLTGLTNRRGLAKQAAALSALAQRRGEPMWCAFLDVDHFKSVNDLLGHDAGDEVLVAVATALRMISRASDLPSRWGGDEFLVLGLGRPPNELDMERRITEQLGQLDHAILRLWTPAVTVGVATAHGNGDGALTELITAADHRMYERREARRSLSAQAGAS